MRYVVGIDAGGSKTVGLLADERGRVVAEARRGGANPHVQGPEAVEETLAQLLEELSSHAPVAAVAVGMAGVDRPGERRRIEAMLAHRGWQIPARIDNDAHVALLAGAPEGVGIVVVAGTGSIAFGVDAQGRRARSGGWGHILGDEGSAFWLGHAALRRGIRGADGRGPETDFAERVAHRLGLDVPSGLISWFYDQELSRFRIAELAPLVEEVALEGDAGAEELLEEAALHLVRAARAVERKLGFEQVHPLVLAGGAFRACPSLAKRIGRHLELPLARPARLDREPAHGAVALALELL